MAHIDDLKSEATGLGVDVDGRWSEARIQAEIEAKKAELALADDGDKGDSDTGDTGDTGEQEAKPTGIVVKNISKNPTWITGSLRCAPGESAIVSGRELEQCRRKIENGVKHGLLEVTE